MPGAGIDRERHGQPQLRLIGRAEISPQRERLASERCGAGSRRAARAPIRIGAVNGEIHCPLWQREWPGDERIDLLS